MPTGANIGDDNLIMMQNGATAELRMAAEKNYRISGHESFPCRYSWLPKAVRDLGADPMLFSDDERAMVALGVGKNMVRSIRFWVQAAGVAAPEKKGSGYSLTDFGRVLLGDRGLDPFLEDSSTLWLLHWNLSTDRENPLLAWDYLLNRWHEPELARSTALKVLHKEAARVDEGISMVTLEQHFDTFLHTYVPTRGRKGQVQEDNLDCPLVELDFLLKVGERGVGKREAIYSFRREEKSEISLELFAYCLDEFWRESRESTLPLREVAHGHGIPARFSSCRRTIFALGLICSRAKLTASSPTLSRPSFSRFAGAKIRTRQRCSRLFIRWRKMPSKRISDLFHIHNRFLRSAHLERDFQDPSALSSYVVTDFTRTCLGRMGQWLEAPFRAARLADGR